jgi:transcriptional regulator with XRE-family HTH domain
MAKMHSHGEWFKERRNMHHLTQAQLAAMVSKDRSYIAQIEGGHRWPSEPVLFAVLNALNVPPAEAIERLDLVKNEDAEKFIRFAEFVEEVSANMPPERMREFKSFFSDRNDLLFAVGSLAAGEPLPPGPEGWHQLHAEDRRLVQRIVNRLLDSYPEPEPGKSIPYPVNDEG